MKPLEATLDPIELHEEFEPDLFVNFEANAYSRRIMDECEHFGSVVFRESTDYRFALGDYHVTNRQGDLVTDNDTLVKARAFAIGWMEDHHQELIDLCQ